MYKYSFCVSYEIGTPVAYEGMSARIIPKVFADLGIALFDHIQHYSFTLVRRTLATPDDINDMCNAIKEYLAVSYYFDKRFIKVESRGLDGN